MKYLLIFFVLLYSTNAIAQIDTIAYSDSHFYSKLIGKIRKIAEKYTVKICTIEGVELNKDDKKVFFNRKDTIAVDNDYSVKRQISIVKNIYPVSTYRFIYLDIIRNKVKRIGIQKELITSEGVYAFDELFWIQKKNCRALRFTFK